MGYELFISYASPDLKFAEALHSRLTDAGFSVWFDKARLNSGCDWHKEIEGAARRPALFFPSSRRDGSNPNGLDMKPTDMIWYSHWSLKETS